MKDVAYNGKGTTVDKLKDLVENTLQVEGCARGGGRPCCSYQKTLRSCEMVEAFVDVGGPGRGEDIM